MRLCSICVLPETFPNIELNRNGICNHCQSFRREKRQEEIKKEYLTKFFNLVKGRRDVGDYDILVAYSGGKDSTYALDVFKKDFHLRILALTFDHGFISPYALKNIKKVTERLGVDHIFFKPDFEMIKSVFLLSMHDHLYPRKALRYGSAICLSCISLLSLVTLKLALEKAIPLVGYGWSPGQIPIQFSVEKINPIHIQAIQRDICEPLCRKIGQEMNSYFIEEKYFMFPDQFPTAVHPLAFLDYDEEKIYQRISHLGWESPQDTDPNSTNCLMNGFANQLHQERFGFHPYAFEMASLVRMGFLSREEGLRRLNKPTDPRIIEEVKKRLGL